MHTFQRAMLHGVAGLALLASALWPRASRGEEPEAPAAAAAPAPEDAAVGEEVVVTATRGPRPLRDVPAAVTVVSRQEIDRSPAKTADELLRIVPSFGLFRRSSSVAADPSSQGVNLRGIGPSGVSRSLVLLDGVPVNDAFGGWVYWRSLGRLSIERIEVVPDGGSALWGNYALGGVTQVISRPIAPLGVDAALEYGSDDTAQAAAWASDREGPLGIALDAELFTSKGYDVVSPAARGAIDKDTPSKHAVVNARAEVAASRELTLGLRGGFFYEQANGGTEFTNAMVRQFDCAATARWAPAGAGAFDLAVFGHKDDFKQDRARIPAGRATESLSAQQDVPAHDLGASLAWASPALSFGGSHVLGGGVDLRLIEGETRENLFPGPTLRDAVGQQRMLGLYVQDVYDATEAIGGTLALRYDEWQNFDASRTDQAQGAAAKVTPFPNQSQGTLSPKAGVRVRPLDWLTLRGEAYRAFRAPTLNELYRPFQVGQVLTQSNDALGPETLNGAEAGLEVRLPAGLTARATGFWDVLNDPIVNVTTTGPNQRQRQNLGQARIRGLEMEAGLRFARAWLATAAYTLVDNRVTDAPGNPQLVGKVLPQDPRYRVTAALAYDDPRLVTVSARMRYSSTQYEDDLNTLPMGEVYLFDLLASWHATKFLDAYLAVENLFDRVYLVGRAGVDTIGQPRFFHGGLRFRMGG